MELSVIPEELKKQHNEIQNYLNMAPMRLRFNPDMYPSILRLDAEVELSRDMIETYINHIPKNELSLKLKKMEL